MPVYFVWTPGHEGFAGNEEADRLAKAGGKLEYMERLGLPIAELKTEISNGIRLKWDMWWQRYPHARQTKFFYPESDKQMGKLAMELTRPQLGRFIRIITGHNNLLYHRSNIDPDIDPMCRFCGEVQETFIHFFTDCPALWHARNDAQYEQPGGQVSFVNPLQMIKFFLYT